MVSFTRSVATLQLFMKLTHPSGRSLPANSFGSPCHLGKRISRRILGLTTNNRMREFRFLPTFLLTLLLTLAFHSKNSDAHEPSQLHCTDKRSSEWWLKVTVHVAEPKDKYASGIFWITDTAASTCNYFPDKKECGWTAGSNFSYGTNFYKAESNKSLLNQELYIDRLKGEAILFVNFRPTSYDCALQTPKY